LATWALDLMFIFFVELILMWGTVLTVWSIYFDCQSISLRWIVDFFRFSISCTAKIALIALAVNLLFACFSKRRDLEFGRLNYLLLTNQKMILQGNRYWRLGIDNGSSSVQEIGSILMEQGQIGRPDRGIGKQQGRTALLCAILGMLEWRKP
jgi:hypothetical protein